MSQLVIIADSSSTIQKVIKITLSEGPFDVETCNDESELLSSISSGINATVILDTQFAEEECVSFVHKLEKLNTNLLFIILYTSRDSSLIQSLANKDNCEFMEKPFEADELVEKCKMLSSKRKHHNEVSTDDDYLDDDNEWKVSVPGVIGHADQKTLDIPDIISSSKSKIEESSLDDFQEVNDVSSGDLTQEFSINEFANVDNSDKDQFPDDSDLEFPDDSSSPKFESIDNLNLDSEDTLTGMPGLQLEESDDDEVEEGNWTSSEPGDFWMPDSNTNESCLLYTSPSPRDQRGSRMPSSA